MSLAHNHFFFLLDLFSAHRIPQFIVRKSLSVLNKYEFIRWPSHLWCFLCYDCLICSKEVTNITVQQIFFLVCRRINDYVVVFIATKIRRRKRPACYGRGSFDLSCGLPDVSRYVLPRLNFVCFRKLYVKTPITYLSKSHIRRNFSQTYFFLAVSVIPPLFMVKPSTWPVASRVKTTDPSPWPPVCNSVPSGQWSTSRPGSYRFYNIAAAIHFLLPRSVIGHCRDFRYLMFVHSWSLKKKGRIK